MCTDKKLMNDYLPEILEFPRRDIEDKSARGLARRFGYIMSFSSSEDLKIVEDAIFRKGTWPLALSSMKKDELTEKLKEGLDFFENIETPSVTDKITLTDKKPGDKCYSCKGTAEMFNTMIVNPILDEEGVDFGTVEYAFNNIRYHTKIGNFSGVYSDKGLLGVVKIMDPGARIMLCLRNVKKIDGTYVAVIGSYMGLKKNITELIKSSPRKMNRLEVYPQSHIEDAIGHISENEKLKFYNHLITVRKKLEKNFTKYSKVPLDIY